MSESMSFFKDTNPVKGRNRAELGFEPEKSFFDKKGDKYSDAIEASEI